MMSNHLDNFKLRNSKLKIYYETIDKRMKQLTI